MSNIVNISTSAELYEALSNAKGGETFVLSGGDYGSLIMNGKTGFPNNFASPIKIMSADADNPAVFTKMTLNGAKNVDIEGVLFDYTFDAKDPSWVRPFEVNNSVNVSITNSTFDGDEVLGGKATDDGYGYGYGLSVRGGREIDVEANEFFEWGRAIIFDDVTDVEVRENDVHNVRVDGLNFVRVQNVLIEDNYIHDFKAAYSAGDHRDMIQFWTNGTDTPSTDIIIRNNTLDMGEGSYTQSIFMRNERVDFQGGGKDMYYQNVLIEGNTIYNGHSHGITVGETDGLIIRKNSLLTVVDDENRDQSDSALWVPAINVNEVSENVSIETNAVATINGHNNQSDWIVKNNAFIQSNNPDAPGYYDDVFVTSSMDVGDDGHHFVALPGSMLETLKAGTDALRAAPSLDNAEALFDVDTVADDQNVRTFDAGVTANVLAEAGITEATYMWFFGDGETAEGQSASHNFTHAGSHDVTLHVKLPSGKTYSADSAVDIRGGQVLSFDGAQGATFVAHSFGDDFNLAALSSFQDGALQLGGTGSVDAVGRSVLSGLRGTDELTIDFALEGDGAGEVFRLHQSFVARVHNNGELGIQMYNEKGENIYVTARDLPINDGKSHDISIQLQDGALQVYVDGTMAGEKAFAGTLPTWGLWDLVFGNPWGQGTNFTGEISAMDISVGEALTPLSSLPSSLPPEIIESSPDLDADPRNENAETIEIEEMLDGAWSIGGQALLGEGTEASTVELTGGWGEHVNLGRLWNLENSDTVAFSVDFTTDPENTGESRLIWNHMKLGLTLRDDEIIVNAATKDEGFKGFMTNGLGLKTGEAHNATVLLDSAADRLQVLVDDKIVLDVDDVDFDHIGAGGYEWGWSIGTAWDRPYKGKVNEFNVSDQFEFYEIEPFSPVSDFEF